MENIHAIIIVVLLYLLFTLYQDGNLTCVTMPIEKILSRFHYNTTKIMNSAKNDLDDLYFTENYAPCPPSDCDKYRVRKDQMIVRNPFLWPYSGSDDPQYAVPYDEVNKTGLLDMVPRQCWRSRPTVNCGDCRCKHPFVKNRSNDLMPSIKNSMST